MVIFCFSFYSDGTPCISHGLIKRKAHHACNGGNKKTKGIKKKNPCISQ